MSDLVYDRFCETADNGERCEHIIYWDHEVEMHDHNRTYESSIECISCTLVGQSYNVEEYPDNCPYLKEIKEWEENEITMRTWRAVGAKDEQTF